MSRYAAIKRGPRTRKRPDGTRRSVGRILHLSAKLVHVRDEETGLSKTYVAKGKTYNVGRNAAKRARRARRFA